MWIRSYWKSVLLDLLSVYKVGGESSAMSRPIGAAHWVSIRGI